MSRQFNLSASLSKPASATQYTNGDIIANSATAALVTPQSFNIDGYTRGRINCAKCIVTPASSSVIKKDLDINLLVFRPVADIPFAAAGYPADNGVLTLTQAMYKQLIAVFRFTEPNWRSPLGLPANGATAWQTSRALEGKAFAEFDLAGINFPTGLVAVVQVVSPWSPGNVANTFDFVLDAELD